MRPCCAVGARADAPAIDEALRALIGLGTLAKRFGIVKGTLGRHRRFCLGMLVGESLTPPSSTQEPKPSRSSMDLEAVDKDMLEGVVYFIQEGNDGPIKIGKTKNVAERRKELQTGNSRRLRVIGVMPGYGATEVALHRRFEALRTGGEWFLPGVELVEFVGRIRATLAELRNEAAAQVTK